MGLAGDTWKMVGHVFDPCHLYRRYQIYDTNMRVRRHILSCVQYLCACLPCGLRQGTGASSLPSMKTTLTITIYTAG